MKIKKLNEFNLNENISDIFKIEYTYEKMVISSLTDIVRESRRISEKDFKNCDIVIDEVKRLVQNDEDIKKLIKQFENENKRVDFCAETIYDMVYNKN